MLRRVAASVAVASLALPFNVGAQTSAPSSRASACAVHELSREPLVIHERTYVYVEADAFVADPQGNTLLAGTPNSLTRMNADGAVTAVVDDSVFGVVIPRTGRARLVPRPIPGNAKLDGIRLVARPKGGWAVSFAEVEPSQGSASADSTVRLWYGNYDGARWTSLEELPLPHSGTVDSRWASSLVNHGDTVSWAMTLRTAAGPQIVLFERRGGRWSHESIPTFHSQVELGRTDALGLALLVVQPHSAPGERFDANSLVLWARRPEWQVVRRLVHGSAKGRVYHPKATVTADGAALAWETPSASPGRRGTELRAMFGRWEDSTVQPVVLDSAVSGLQGYSDAVPVRSGGRVWVTLHTTEDRTRSSLRYLQSFGGSAVTVGEVANPYLGFIAATAPRPMQVLVTGLQHIPNRYLVSYLLRARIDCSGGPVSRP